MKLSFREENQFTPTNLQKLEDILTNKNTVLLHHADYCGHCQTMRGEFEKFKTETSTNVVEIESSALSTAGKHKKIAKRIIPSNGQMYFPLIIIFIKKADGKTSKRIVYKGPRTAEALKDKIKSLTQKKRVVKKKST